ncbi:hypothetical protein B0H15DRAFT_1005152 [Mycena belliarum]|uniref:Right handed beta helix domain-containing protein n=1 Tax=Mycena belliarum TaxID=1033014 RepID=A0AAD6UJ70_9AGAR|nr:hypothetical protein B0H15DRAFT_1005152 [Mycena belliae]
MARGTQPPSMGRATTALESCCATYSGGANIEFGGGNANQTIQFVRSYDPRSWSCLHIAEGPFTCSGVLVQNNDIGPCGVDAFQEWADGISVSCRNAVVRNNMVQGATDGGIVLFGSPGTQVYNNTIWVTNQTMLGGINMVDFLPWQGDYTDTVVRDNTILGGFATSAGSYHSNKGTNADDVVMKIAIAIGPRTWFGDRYQENVSFSGTVLNNRLSGAFSYGIAMSTARNFTIKNNVLFGNSSFIGASGPNCSASDVVPNPAPFVYDKSATEVTLQPDFQLITDAESLTCVRPPEGGNYWPYGGNPGSAGPTGASPAFDSSSLIKTASSSTAAVVLGVIAGITALGVATWFIRKWLMRRLEEKNLYNAAKELAVGTGPGYVKHE